MFPHACVCPRFRVPHPLFGGLREDRAGRSSFVIHTQPQARSPTLLLFLSVTDRETEASTHTATSTGHAFTQVACILSLNTSNIKQAYAQRLLLTRFRSHFCCLSLSLFCCRNEARFAIDLRRQRRIIYVYSRCRSISSSCVISKLFPSNRVSDVWHENVFSDRRTSAAKQH